MTASARGRGVRSCNTPTWSVVLATSTNRASGCKICPALGSYAGTPGRDEEERMDRDQHEADWKRIFAFA
jgi:hypothetical protein